MAGNNSHTWRGQHLFPQHDVNEPIWDIQNTFCEYLIICFRYHCWRPYSNLIKTIPQTRNVPTMYTSTYRIIWKLRTVNLNAYQVPKQIVNVWLWLNECSMARHTFSDHNPISRVQNYSFYRINFWPHLPCCYSPVVGSAVMTFYVGADPRFQPVSLPMWVYVWSLGQSSW